MNLVDQFLEWGINLKEFVGGASGGVIAAITDTRIKSLGAALRHVATGGLIAGYGGTFLANKIGITSAQGTVFFSFCIGVAGMYVAEHIKQWVKERLSNKNKKGGDEHGTGN